MDVEGLLEWIFAFEMLLVQRVVTSSDESMNPLNDRALKQVVL